MRKQESPFCVQVELTEGCNLRCPMCGLNAIRGKDHDFKFMREETLRSVMRQFVQLGWNPRIEMAMRGEPSQHPDYVGMVRAAREEAPGLQLMMTSNGSGFLREPGVVQNVESIFEAGLNILALDEYSGINWVGRVRAALYAHLDAGKGDVLRTIDFYEYPNEPEGNPHRRQRRGRRMVSFIEDIFKATKGTHSVINNHAGNGGPPLKEPLKERCAKPFRELGVRWDGRMALCCVDWRGVYKIGDLVKDGVEACWNSPAMEAARHMLYAADRNFGVCKGCDHPTYRNGLLPDKLGKETLPAPTKRHRKIAAEACAGPPYATPILRPWEKP